MCYPGGDNESRPEFCKVAALFMASVVFFASRPGAKGARTYLLIFNKTPVLRVFAIPAFIPREASSARV